MSASAIARLAELGGEIARISQALARADGAQAWTLLDQRMLARALFRTRRMREQFFDAALFADPAWDMLLDLFEAHLDRRAISVSSLCIAAAVPPTTALRWIDLLAGRGLVERRPDPADRRRTNIALSARAADAMAGYTISVLRHLAPVQRGAVA